MLNSLPFKIEYSYGEKTCKKCEKKIRSGCLNIAILMQSEDDDCQYADWFHQKCFFTIRMPKSPKFFDGFAKIRYADQIAIKKQLGNVENENNENKIQKKVEKAKLPDFHIGYTRSDGDSCASCKQRIQVPDIRIMHVVYNTDLTVENDAFTAKACFYHVACFVRLRYEMSWLESASLLPGFKRLSEKDKELVNQQIPIIKRKFHVTTNDVDPNLAELEKRIETQNREYFELYDKLAKIPKKEQIDILNYNNETIPKTKNEILHALTEIIYYGKLSTCEKCYGRLIFNNTTYSCTKILEWGKCSNNINEPKRFQAYVRYEICRKYPFLDSYIVLFIAKNVRTRALHPFRFENENEIDLVNECQKTPPLLNMEFAIIGKLKLTKQSIECAIRQMGGRVVEKIHDKLAAVISNQDEIERMGSKMIKAKECNIQIVSEEFLSKMETIDPFVYIINRSLSEWGGNPYSRIEQPTIVKSRRETIYYTKSVPEKITYKINDGGSNLVDYDSGLQQTAHIFCEEVNGKQLKYIVICGLVDIERNKNSYFRMQLLESNDEPKTYWIFETWGRIATVIGSKRLTPYATSKEATEKFRSIYLNRTGNEFGKYSFTTKMPGKFYHLDIDFAFAKTIPKTYVATKLKEPIHQLMKLIFDMKHMKQMMISCDVDLKQMPLGNVSSNQIYLAMSVLKNIAKLIENGTIGQLRDASNQFYTMIPHGNSVKRLPIIDSIDVVKSKIEMLESLLHMGTIHGFLEGENGEKKNPLDACYEKMKTEIEPLDKNALQFKQICEIVQNTHGTTHDQYRLEVLDVFKLRRKREDVRSRAYKKIEHQLLWHGSRLTNFVSILSKGLRIAPKEAPATGYMFGKGIYFADMISKSANYCHPSRENNIGIALLCDVAIGTTHNPRYAGNVEKLPNECEQSVKGCGEIYPSEFGTIDGIKVATGGLRKAEFQTSLKYNEYVVYDIAQAKMKYLVKLKYHFK
ncbi:poly [ADP-ribose] polymerase-like isoform X2 [Contarinia nasturtii]|uniref:poly [ADP-ribose] polymerase-like isoform X2 n=1 Tax=Contarinia nasturtii TaxID=265458 RepID=UPI0012D3F838|nr:poly [ADP-ribose] polymerase-like isoform X2 [Contarinia nasturtii]